jgi:predicted transcriptional regulator YdeE
MEPHMVDREAFTVVGAAKRGMLGEFKYGEIWENQFMPMHEILKPYSIDGGYYGVTVGEDDHLVYLAGMAVADLLEIPVGAEKLVVKAAHYAVFDCVVATIGETWQSAYGQWLPASAYELDTSAVDFEYYPPYPGQGEMKVEIYIPVKVKQFVN